MKFKKENVLKAAMIFWLRQSFPALVLTGLLLAGWGLLAGPNGAQDVSTSTRAIAPAEPAAGAEAHTSLHQQILTGTRAGVKLTAWKVSRN